MKSNSTSKTVLFVKGLFILIAVGLLSMCVSYLSTMHRCDDVINDLAKITAKYTTLRNKVNEEYVDVDFIQYVDKERQAGSEACRLIFNSMTNNDLNGMDAITLATEEVHDNRARLLVTIRIVTLAAGICYTIGAVAFYSIISDKYRLVKKYKSLAFTLLPALVVSILVGLTPWSICCCSPLFLVIGSLNVVTQLKVS